jgi:hypothetical protein
VTKPAPGETHRFPDFLPGGVRFVFLAGGGNSDSAGVYVASIDGTAPVRVLPRFSNAVFTPTRNGSGPGYLLFRRDDALVAQSFDPYRLQLAGEAIPLAEKLSRGLHTGYSTFSVSNDGTLAHGSGERLPIRQLVWRDRTGKRVGTSGKPAQLGEASLSPDEKRVAVSIMRPQGGWDIWLYELSRESLSRFTFSQNNSFAPILVARR